MKTQTLFFLVCLMMVPNVSISAQEVDTTFQKQTTVDTTLLKGATVDTVFKIVEIEKIKLRPIRVGMKLGLPNLIGGNLEYLTPLVNDKLSVNWDYSIFKSDWISVEATDPSEKDPIINYSFIDLGANYYIFKPGRGLYSGLSYSLIKFDSETSVYGKDEFGGEKDGTEYYNVKNNSVNVKVGAKLGGLFYFRPELGFSFNPIPETVSSEIRYNDGSKETTTTNINDELQFKTLTSGLTFNIGMGFAF